MTPPALFICAMLAYSVHEHQEGFVRHVHLSITETGFTLRDDGRGMGLHKAGYAENLMGTLVRGPGPVQLHGVGLSIVAASVPKLLVKARRGGNVLRQSFSWGLADGEVTSEPATEPGTGTEITVSLHLEDPASVLKEIEPQLRLWTTANPGLAIHT